jgi:hypothetical protein
MGLVASTAEIKETLMPSWNVARSIEIAAGVSQVYELIADFNTWTSWSPWLVADPKATVQISDVPNGVGSKYHWKGDILGEGELEHLKLQTNTQILTDLRFISPMKSVCKTGFELRGLGEKTLLTWKIDGSLPWFLFWLKPSIIQMIGDDYQRGLLMIRELAERGKISSQVESLGTESFASLRIAGIEARTSLFEFDQSVEQLRNRLDQEYREEGLPLEGLLVSVLKRTNTGPQGIEYLLGRAIPDSLILPTHSKLIEWRYPACKAFHIRHLGSHEHFPNALAVAERLAKHQRLKLDRRFKFGIHTTVTPQFPGDALQTDLYLPLRA